LSPKASKNLNSIAGQKVRVYTLTFQFTRNYGANLQAYALQEFLERSGCEAQIVDYWPTYAESKFRWNSVFTRNPSVGSLLLILKIYRLNRVFEAFKRKHFKLTKKCRSIEDIKALPQPDVYFVGSDQVWNNQILGEYNQAYLLDFDTTAVKASYAASAGKDHFSSEELDMLVQYAKRLDYVSVREDSFRVMLKAHGLADVMDHIDPVFLLDREDYRSISRCRKEGQYILIYYPDAENLTEKLALRLSEMNGGIPIYRVGKQKNRNGRQGLQNVPVEEFLGLIDHAACVVSCSFHACALSIVFRKQFYAISAGDRSSRLTSLLDRFDLANRFVPDENALNQLQVSDIDYSQHEDLIAQHTEIAKSYIKGVIDAVSVEK
jgi:hypothetical protein